jgi:hypothetical protein
MGKSPFIHQFAVCFLWIGLILLTTNAYSGKALRATIHLDHPQGDCGISIEEMD